MKPQGDVKDVVRERYGQAAVRVAQDETSSCCGAGARSECGADPITSNLYDALQAGEVPEKAL